MSDSVQPHGQQPTRLPCPWDSPGKNTGVGCHFLLQCMKVKSETEVAQSCPTLRDPMDCSLPGSSAHGIFQARVLEWDAIAFSVVIYVLMFNVFSLRSRSQLLHLKWFLSLSLKPNHHFIPLIVGIIICDYFLSWFVYLGSLVAQCLQCGRPGFDPWVRKIPWRREWQPTPVFLLGEFHGQRSLLGYHPWGHKESVD